MIACTAGVVTPNMVMPIAGPRETAPGLPRLDRGHAGDHAGERVRGVAEHLLGDRD